MSEVHTTEPNAPACFGAGFRFDPADRRGHVESYFVKLVDPRARRAVWLRWTVLAGARRKQPPTAEVWAVAFREPEGHVAVKSSVPFEDGQFARDAVAADVDGCVLRQDHARGSVATGDRRIDYDLRFHGADAPLAHYSARWMYADAAPWSKIVSPIPRMLATGRVVVNGQAWEVEGWPAMLGHNWGRRHPAMYGWGHCDSWEGADGARVLLEGVSARVRMGLLASPMATILHLSYAGVRHAFGAPSDLVRSRGLVTPRRWSFEARRREIEVRGELWASTDELVGLYYANPDGTMSYCLNSKLAHGRLEIVMPGRPPHVLTTRAAALEIGTREPTHGVTMYV